MSCARARAFTGPWINKSGRNSGTSAKIHDHAFRDHDVVRRLDVGDEVRSKQASREAGALQIAMFNRVNFSSIANDANGVIQIVNVGAERMLGYPAAQVMN